MERYENFRQINMRRANEKANKTLVTVLSIIMVVLMFFLGILIGFSFKFEYVAVDGPSMQDTINPNPVPVKVKDKNGDIVTRYYQDGVIIEHSQNVKRSEIVIINIPGRDDTIIKRVIATAGDKVTIKKVKIELGESDSVEQYRVVIIPKNSIEPQVLEESYIKSYEEWGAGKNSTRVGDVDYEESFYNEFLKDNANAVSQDGTLYFQVPNGQFFYLGDNRTVSQDARANGCAKLGQIEGIVRVIIRDAYTMKQKGTLNWTIISRGFAYVFGQLGDYFAWKG